MSGGEEMGEGELFLFPANMAKEEVAKLIVGNDSACARPVLLVTCQGCFH